MRFEKAARALVRTGVGVDARRLEVGVPERLRDERDRRAVVDGVRGVGMAQPMRRRLRVAAGALHDRPHDVVDAPLGNREHPIRRRSVTAHGQQRLRYRGRQQHVARLVALADERQLDLASLTRQDLRPGQRGDLGDAQGAVVADLAEDPLAARLRRAQDAQGVELRQDALRQLPGRLSELDQRRGVEAGIADLMCEAEQRLHDGDVGVDRCGLGRRAVEFDPDRLERGLHIIERCAPQIDAGNLEGIEEAAADPPIGPHSVVRAVDVRLEPDREQLEVGSRRRPGGLGDYLKSGAAMGRKRGMPMVICCRGGSTR